MPPTEPILFTFFRNTSLWVQVPVLFCLGACVGRVIVLLIPRIDLPDNLWTRDRNKNPAGLLGNLPLIGFAFAPHQSTAQQIRKGAALKVELSTVVLYIALVGAVIRLGAQQTPMEGSGFYIHWRLIFQFVLVAFLIAATVIDLELYLIPDAITFPGLLFGVCMATAVGQLHLTPVWVDWNQAQPGLTGPYIPDWIGLHPHWHGAVWSLTGAAVGAGITWLVRAGASMILRQEALGLGDVTLMGMIGSYLGWQPIVFVFLLAAPCGLVVGLAIRLMSGKTYLPYGPYLSAAAIVVLLGWSRLWTPTRETFGDWTTLGILAISSLVVGTLLLIGLRLYRLIPVERRTSSTDDPQL